MYQVQSPWSQGVYCHPPSMLRQTAMNIMKPIKHHNAPWHVKDP